MIKTPKIWISWARIASKCGKINKILKVFQAFSSGRKLIKEALNAILYKICCHKSVGKCLLSACTGCRGSENKDSVWMSDILF